MSDLARRLSQMLLGGMQGWETGSRLSLMAQSNEDRNEQREADRVLRSAALADRGIYKGEAPGETHDIEVPVPGLPLPLKLRLRDSDRYQDLGSGYYQDQTMSPAGRARAGQQAIDARARQNRFEEVWDREQKLATASGEHQRVRDAVRGSGLFTSGEMGLVDAIPGIGDDVAQSAINARTRRRYDGPTGRTANDPAERAIRHEDDRRKSLVAGNEAKIRRASAEKDPITGEVLNSDTITDLEATTDSIRARIGTPPDPASAVSGRDTRTIPNADAERDLAEQADDAIRRGANPERVNARLRQLLQQLRAGSP